MRQIQKYCTTINYTCAFNLPHKGPLPRKWLATGQKEFIDALARFSGRAGRMGQKVTMHSSREQSSGQDQSVRNVTKPQRPSCPSVSFRT
jgi:hypothetical protein